MAHIFTQLTGPAARTVAVAAALLATLALASPVPADADERDQPERQQSCSDSKQRKRELACIISAHFDVTRRRGVGQAGGARAGEIRGLAGRGGSRRRRDGGRYRIA